MAVCLFRDVVAKTDHGRINTLYIDHVYTRAGLFVMDWKLYTFFIPHRQAQMSMHFCRDNTIHVTFSHSPILLGVTGLRHSRLVKDWQRKRSMLQWSSTGSLGLLPGTCLGYAEDWEKGPAIFPRQNHWKVLLFRLDHSCPGASIGQWLHGTGADELRSLMPW